MVTRTYQLAREKLYIFSIAYRKAIATCIIGRSKGGRSVSLPQGRISCIICAYNEGERIRHVLDAIVGNPIFGEIIVVDDGCTDNTGTQVRAHPNISLVSYMPNRGKSYALARGLLMARCEYIMLLDADLLGLDSRHIEALAGPVLRESADVSISLRGNSLPLYRMIGLDFVSGERVLPRRLLLASAEAIMRLPKWAGEVFVNQLIIEQSLRLAVVDWPDVSHIPKRLKVGQWQGTVEDLRMIGDALRFLTPVGVVQQNVALLRLARPAGAVELGTSMPKRHKHRKIPRAGLK